MNMICDYPNSKVGDMYSFKRALTQLAYMYAIQMQYRFDAGKSINCVRACVCVCQKESKRLGLGLALRMLTKRP